MQLGANLRVYPSNSIRKPTDARRGAPACPHHHWTMRRERCHHGPHRLSASALLSLPPKPVTSSSGGSPGCRTKTLPFSKGALHRPSSSATVEPWTSGPDLNAMFPDKLHKHKVRKHSVVRYSSTQTISQPRVMNAEQTRLLALRTERTSFALGSVMLQRQNISA